MVGFIMSASFHRAPLRWMMVYFCPSIFFRTSFFLLLRVGKVGLGFFGSNFISGDSAIKTLPDFQSEPASDGKSMVSRKRTNLKPVNVRIRQRMTLFQRRSFISNEDRSLFAFAFDLHTAAQHLDQVRNQCHS